MATPAPVTTLGPWQTRILAARVRAATSCQSMVSSTSCLTRWTSGRSRPNATTRGLPLPAVQARTGERYNLARHPCVPRAVGAVAVS